MKQFTRCPRCGSTKTIAINSILRHWKPWFAWCTHCEHTGPYAHTERGAFRKWRKEAA